MEEAARHLLGGHGEDLVPVIAGLAATERAERQHVCVAIMGPDTRPSCRGVPEAMTMTAVRRGRLEAEILLHVRFRHALAAVSAARHGLAAVSDFEGDPTEGPRFGVPWYDEPGGLGDCRHHQDVEIIRLFLDAGASLPDRGPCEELAAIARRVGAEDLVARLLPDE